MNDKLLFLKGVLPMSKIIFFNSYKLKKGTSVPDFLLAVEKLNNEYISKQKGYVSFSLMVDGETWADSTTFETMEDAKAFAGVSEPNELAKKFYSFLNLSTCRSNFFSVERSF
jgi:hypothetical protein